MNTLRANRVLRIFSLSSSETVLPVRRYLGYRACCHPLSCSSCNNSKKINITKCSTSLEHLHAREFHSTINLKAGLFKQMRMLLCSIHNSVESWRLPEIGGNLVCADWLLKNGAIIKWRGKDKVASSYSDMPKTGYQTYIIDEIYCVNGSVMHNGFSSFKFNLDIRKVVFHNCEYFNDLCLNNFKYIPHSLEFVQISKADDVTENKFLSVLGVLRNLKVLVVFDLKQIPDLDSFAKKVKEILPNCEVYTYDPCEEESESSVKT